MKTDVTLHGDVACVRVEGRIVDGEAEDELKATLKRVLGEGRIHTIVDVTNVTWFDSLAIGILVAHYVSSTNRGGKVLLLGANHKIRSLLEVARISDRFGWASNLDDALRWLAAR